MRFFDFAPGIAPRLALFALLALTLFGAGTAAAQNPYNSLTLEWVAPGDDGNTGTVSGYEVYYGTSPDPTTGSAQLITGPPCSPAGQMDQVLVTGLTPGTRYYFAIRAFDEWQNYSPFSNVATDTTQSCAAPTTAPQNMTAVSSTGQIAVSWDAATDPLAQTLHLYRAVGPSGPFTQIQDLALSTLNFTDTNVSAGQLYRYRAAYAGPACEGPVSSTASATVPGPSAPPPTPAMAASSIHVYPNPASASMRVVVDVQATAAMPVYLRLFDMTGHWIATLVNGNYPPGTTEVPWGRLGRDNRTVGPGYYEIIGTVGLTKVRERVVLLP